MGSSILSHRKDISVVRMSRSLMGKATFTWTAPSIVETAVSWGVRRSMKMSFWAPASFFSRAYLSASLTPICLAKECVGISTTRFINFWCIPSNGSISSSVTGSYAVSILWIPMSKVSSGRWLVSSDMDIRNSSGFTFRSPSLSIHRIVRRTFLISTVDDLPNNLAKLVISSKSNSPSSFTSNLLKTIMSFSWREKKERWDDARMRCTPSSNSSSSIEPIKNSMDVKYSSIETISSPSLSIHLRFSLASSRS
mmetsp:Transcript_26674/g.36813  ORF Transcript_26674/g.36813 Transcript_26674/m.36813 type:complete len:252 (-) Transcript_26674:52-807(-)